MPCRAMLFSYSIQLRMLKFAETMTVTTVPTASKPRTAAVEAMMIMLRRKTSSGSGADM